MIRCSCGAELFSIESICSVCIPSKPPRALFVEDLRIKLANRELEILDWKEAAEIANAENDDLRREVAATTKHAQLLNKMLGEAEAERDRLRPALEGMVHYATHNEGWQDDHPEYLEAARAALGGASARGEVADAAPAVCEWKRGKEDWLFIGCRPQFGLNPIFYKPEGACEFCSAPIKFTEAK